MTRQGIKSPSHPHGHTQDGQQKVDAQGPTTAASPNTSTTTILDSQEQLETTTATLDALVSITGHKVIQNNNNLQDAFFFLTCPFRLSISLWRPENNKKINVYRIACSFSCRTPPLVISIVSESSIIFSYVALITDLFSSSHLCKLGY